MDDMNIGNLNPNKCQKYCSFKKNLGLFCPNKCWYKAKCQQVKVVSEK